MFELCHTGSLFFANCYIWSFSSNCCCITSLALHALTVLFSFFCFSPCKLLYQITFFCKLSYRLNDLNLPFALFLLFCKISCPNSSFCKLSKRFTFFCKIFYQINTPTAACKIVYCDISDALWRFRYFDVMSLLWIVGVLQFLFSVFVSNAKISCKWMLQIVGLKKLGQLSRLCNLVQILWEATFCSTWEGWTGVDIAQRYWEVFCREVNFF